jgi:formylglycine-generating enzyme required for sulfatase activity
MAFLSYCHQDNDTDHNWIMQAGEQLEKEIRSLVGADVRVFRDRYDTQAGKWKANHDEVLDAAQFLIPFVTPCFLQSKSCRREVRRFHKRKKQGIIVPVFYIGTTPATPVEKRIQQILAKYHGFQWRELREKAHGVGTVTVRRRLRELAGFIKDAYHSPPRPIRVSVHVDTLRLVVNTDKHGADMVRIPSGRFKMGSGEFDGEKPAHEVLLTDYCIGRSPVTNAQYRRFCDTTGRDYPPDPRFADFPHYFAENPEYPVVNVTWEDARAYCKWAGKRLPTEAEWEKAARGEAGREYPWGEDRPDDSRANFDYNRGATTPVGTFSAGASPYGLLDMAGNVWEWCNDWHEHNYYKTSPSENPKGPGSGLAKVIRGGSWYNRPDDLRCACRYWFAPSDRNNGIGFRCADDA